MVNALLRTLIHVLKHDVFGMRAARTDIRGRPAVYTHVKQTLSCAPGGLENRRESADCNVASAKQGPCTPGKLASPTTQDSLSL
eukprot:scaffold78014_cov75-Phaeocystis_antarctica.AAC.4